jgi:hypothetical protein
MKLTFIIFFILLLPLRFYSQSSVCENVIDISLNEIVNFNPEVGEGDPDFPNNMPGACTMLTGIGGKEQIYRFVAPSNGIYNFQTQSTLPTLAIEYLYKIGNYTECSNQQWNCIGQSNQIRTLAGLELTQGTELFILANSRSVSTAYNQSFRLVGPTPLACENLQPIFINQEVTFSSDTLMGSPRFVNSIGLGCHDYIHQGGQEQMYVFTPQYSGRYRIQLNSSLNSNRVNYYKRNNLQDICSIYGWDCISYQTNDNISFDILDLEAGIPVVFLLNAERYLTPTSVNFEITYEDDIVVPTPLIEIFLEQEVNSIASIDEPVYIGFPSFSCGVNLNNGGSYDNFVFEAPESGFYKVDILGGTPVNFSFYYSDFVEDYINDPSYSCWHNSTQWNTESEHFTWKYLNQGQKALFALRTAELSHDLTFKVVKSSFACESPVELNCNEPTAIQISAGYLTNPALSDICFPPIIFKEKFAKFTSTQTGIYNIHILEADFPTAGIHAISSNDLSPCDISSWNCFGGFSSGDVSSLQIFLNTGETLYLLFSNTSFINNNIVIEVQCNVSLFCEEVIPITTHLENVFHNESSIALASEYLESSTCGGSQLNYFVGKPRIYLYTAENEGTTTIQVSSVLNNKMFAYYFQYANTEPCNISNWICLGQRNSPGIVNDFTAILGQSYYILVVPFSHSQPSEQSFFVNRNLVSLNSSVDISPIICHNSQSGFIHVNLPTSSNISNYTVLWSDLEYSGENITQRNNLSGGDYTVYLTINLVTSSDPLNLQATYHIEELPALSAIINVSPPDNATFNNGSIELIPYNARGVSDVIWTQTGELSNSISNIPAGTYCAQILDEFGCTADTCIELVASQVEAITFSYVTNDIQCNGDATGSLDIFVQGGSAPYLIEWPQEGFTSTQFSRNNLTAGDYPFTIFDTAGNSTSGIIFIEQNNPILTIETVCPLILENPVSSATIHPIGGIPDYEIQWSHLSGDSQPFELENLTSGKYCYSIIDGLGCTYNNCIELAQITTIPFETSIDLILHPCNPMQSQTAYVITSGGTGPFTYDWLHIPGNINTIKAHLPPVAGTYTVVITDSNLDVRVETFSLGNVSELIVTGTSSPTTGFGSALGQIQLTITTNNPPYSIDWAEHPEFANQSTISDIPGGWYYVTVTDSNGCSSSLSFFIETIITELVLDVNITHPTCLNTDNGAIETQLIHGTLPVTYDWTHFNLFSEPGDIDELGPGVYTLFATDANGLSVNYTFTLEALSTLDVQLNPTAAASEGSLDGSIEAVVTGGVPPYQIIWSHLDYLGPTEMFEVDQLNPGLYHALVFDGEGCVVSASATIDNISSVDQINDSESGISIYPNPSNGTFVIDKKMDFEIEQLEIYNSLGQLVKTLSPNFSRHEISLASGNYYIKITNANSTVTKKIQIF